MWENRRLACLSATRQTAFQSQKALPISSIYYPSAMHSFLLQLGEKMGGWQHTTVKCHCENMLYYICFSVILKLNLKKIMICICKILGKILQTVINSIILQVLFLSQLKQYVFIPHTRNIQSQWDITND